MRNPSNMQQHSFSRTPKVHLPRSVFNRSHTWIGTFDSDYLIPFYVDEVLPGDSVNLKANVLLRLNSPTIKAPLDNLWLEQFYFFVPNRLLQANWKKLMGEQANPADSISFNVPQVTGPNVASSGIPIGHLFDYMGIPVGPLSGGGATTGITFNNLHGRAYNQIWNNWFRSQNLQNSVTVDVGDGPDTFSNYNLLKICKKFDYMTAGNPWPLKGGTEVTLPLGTSAKILPTATEHTTGAIGDSMKMRRQSDGSTYTGYIYGNSSTIGGYSSGGPAAPTGPFGMYPSNLYADLTTATSATLNTLRQSVALQQFLERDARGGTRYPELVRSHFGVENPDSRVQIPELLATYSERINITPVAQTAPKGSAGTLTDQGNLSGFGTAATYGKGFFKSFTEHGVLLGLIAVRADIKYEQGLDKMWSRRTRYDFFWPTYQGLGEQPVLNKEIYANLADTSTSTGKEGVFSYMPRYEEYRFKMSKICGNMRSYNGAGTNANTLNVWHFGEAYSAQPTLSATWIQSAVPLDRTISVPAQDHFLVDAYFDLKHARVVPTFGIPGLSRL